ncbi:hypothetical protein BJ978_000330 [Agromyces terreus]|uniref:Uncharacterized protein n=1 Tax=Agromyces terreus TaxID=424795 RepID=A0A9X2KAK4_9MICO|nr:hypothetical protein [Agromyces terreus]MCP2369654.1 hypothetical protein [Agromyces terreus]
MRKTRIATLLVLMLASAGFGAGPAFADSASDPGPGNTLGSAIPASVVSENDPTLTHQYDIYINNIVGGAIDKVVGSVHTRAGNVLRPVTAVTAADAGFWATKYDKALDGTRSVLVANSVYALHVKVGPDSAYDPADPQAWTARIFTVRPKEFHANSGGTYSASTLYTDIAGGSQIFGGYSSPPSGSSVKYLAGGTWKPITEYYSDGNWAKPVPGHLLFSVYKPTTENGTIDYIEFENWAAGDTVAGVTKAQNGRILLHYPALAPVHIADVLQRVAGTGRFHGTEFAKVGQLTTNHPGAITISTSPRVGWVNYNTQSDLLGGFQIVPANHAKFLHHQLGQQAFFGRTQWLIVGPAGSSSAMLTDPRYLIGSQLSYSPGWEGIAPLFGGYLRTTMVAGDTANSTYAEVSTDFGVTWNAMPSISGTTELPTSPAANWTNIRVHIGG